VSEAPVEALLIGASDDAVLRHVRASLTAKDVSARLLSHLDYSSAVTLHRDDRGRSIVTPDVPVMLRRWCTSASSALSAFSLNEHYAHLWSAVALTESRVINRPDHSGQVTSHPRSLISRLWANAPELRALVPHEWYCDSFVPSPAVEFEALNPFPNETLADVPKRVRHRKPQGWLFARVTVVGESAWQASRFDHCLEWLCPLTLRIAAALNLSFCQVIWRVAPRTLSAYIARVSPEPSAADLQPLLDRTCSALADFLMS
jgi:hypothetical protein